MDQSKTTWEKGSQDQAYPTLKENLQTEVLIVGGGLTGIVTAYLLAKAGVKTVVLEASKIGFGASLQTTALMTKATDLSFKQLIETWDLERAKQMVTASREAINTLERLAREESIDCNFERCPLFFYASDEKDFAILQADYKASQQLGIDVALKQDSALGFANHGYLELINEAKFNPILFIQGLARKAEQLGVKIFEHSEVVDLAKTGAPQAKTKDGHSVMANSVVITTYQPIGKPPGLSAKKARYKSYVLETQIPSGIMPSGMYIDMATPYHYCRLDNQQGFDRFIVGGEDHRWDLPIGTKQNFAALRRYLVKLLPQTKFTIVGQWSGMLLESIDGLPFIGKYATQRYVATGFSGNGMTYAVIAAEIFRDLITGQSNSLSEFYNPNRKIIFNKFFKNAKRYVAVFFGGAVRNTLIGLFKN